MVGTTHHIFTVEKGVAHELQINLDIVVAMNCNDLHVNVQDASGDRIMAGETLKKEATTWLTWSSGRQHEGLSKYFGHSERNSQAWDKNAAAQQLRQYTKEDDVHDFLSLARGKRRFAKTPRLRNNPDACRVFGSLEGNKVQGDFHITARGHGYMELGEHLDHRRFNFTHHINELSFGPFYPSLHNPLDDTVASTEAHFHKFQYYLSVVPTIYTDAFADLTELEAPNPKHPSYNPYAFAPHTVFTNQYAVTEQSHAVGEQGVPGVFVKYDIEPILLTVSEEWGGIIGLAIRCVNVIAGVLVAGGWLVKMSEWALDMWGKRRRRNGPDSGLLAVPEKQGLA